MKTHITLIGLFVIANLAACSSPQDLKAEAEAGYLNEKTNTLKTYKDCVMKAGTDEAKLKQCEHILKAVNAVEGTPTQSVN